MPIFEIKLEWKVQKTYTFNSEQTNETLAIQQAIDNCKEEPMNDGEKFVKFTKIELKTK